MKVIKTKFKGLKIIKQKDNKDNRGSLRETYNINVVGKRNFVLLKKSWILQILNRTNPRLTDNLFHILGEFEI